MIARLNGRTALALSTLIVLALASVGWFLLLSPQRSKAAELDDQISAAHTQLALARVISRGSGRQASNVPHRRLETAMPDNVRMSEILRQLSWAAAAAHVRIEGITPQGVAPHTGYQAIPLSVTLQGRYFAIARFLQLLHTQAVATGSQVHATGRLFAVDGIQFSTASDDELIQASLSIAAFSYASAPGSSSQPLDASAGGSPRQLASAAPATTG
jgi:Tfp pilus assembly protein PilO